MTFPSSLLHLVLMFTKNVLALVKIVSSASDPMNFIEAIFTVLFQSWASSVWTVGNVPYKEAYFSPTLTIHHWGCGTQCLIPWYFYTIFKLSVLQAICRE